MEQKKKLSTNQKKNNPVETKSDNSEIIDLLKEILDVLKTRTKEKGLTSEDLIK